MRVIFLDIDGVLNTRAWLETDSAFKATRRAEDALNPHAVSRLNALISTSGASVVMSSVWRIRYSLHKLRGILERAGVRGPIIDRTPLFTRGMPQDGVLLRERLREDNITAWLDAREGIEGFVVLDDLEGFDQLAPWHVWVDSLFGLRDEDVARALLILEETSGR